MTNEELIKRVQDALNTEETGEGLIEVARNAHKWRVIIILMMIHLANNLK